MTQATVELMKPISFFRGMTDEHLQRLADISRIDDFPVHQPIFHEHDPAKNVYIIVSGKVSLAICTAKLGCRQMMEVGAGELFGWSPLLGRPRLSDTATTLAETKTITFDGKQLLDLCETVPEFGYHFMRRLTEVLAERLAAARLQLYDAAGPHLPEVSANTD